MNRSKGSRYGRSSSSGSKSAKSSNGSGSSNGDTLADRLSTNPSDVSAASGKKVKQSKKSGKAVAKSTANGANDKTKAVLSHQTAGSTNGVNQSVTNAINKAKFPDPEPKKLERSHSFISRGFSKLKSSLTGSRDGINKIPEDKELSTHSSTNSSPEPPRFRRSLTLGSFSIKRRSMRESALEKLSEEHELRHKEGDSNSTSPRDSQSIVQSPSEEVGVTLREERRDEEWRESERTRRTSFGQMSLADIDKDASRYGSGLLSRLKRTFSITSDKRKQMNPMWSVSLQNLQSIDNMVSYDDLSFIDYDKFNEMDKRYDQVLTASQMYLNRMSTGSQPTPPKAPFEKELSLPTPDAVDGHCQLKYSPSTKSETSAQEVKRREPKLHTDHTKNLDEVKNLYRQSLDSQKLQFLNQRNRESFRFSSHFDPNTVDYLLLDNCAVPVNSDKVVPGDDESVSISCASNPVTVRRRRDSEPCLNVPERCDPLVSCSPLLSPVPCACSLPTLPNDVP